MADWEGDLQIASAIRCDPFELIFQRLVGNGYIVVNCKDRYKSDPGAISKFDSFYSSIELLVAAISGDIFQRDCWDAV